MHPSCPPNVIRPSHSSWFNHPNKFVGNYKNLILNKPFIKPSASPVANYNRCKNVLCSSTVREPPSSTQLNKCSTTCGKASIPYLLVFYLVNFVTPQIYRRSNVYAVQQDTQSFLMIEYYSSHILVRHVSDLTGPSSGAFFTSCMCRFCMW